MSHRPYPLALIVDDDISLRLSMRAALAKAEFEAIEAENGQIALSLFQSEKPDIILLDVMMPGLDGFETCEAIRQLPGGKYVQIIMVTGKDDSESTKRAFEVGANDFVAKPINWIMLGYRGRYMLRAGQAFQELTRSKQRLTKIQQIAKLGNWEIVLAGNTFHCSLEAARLLGLSFDKGPVTYKEFLSPIVSNEKDRVQQEIENSLHLNKSFRINYRVILPDGSQRYILNHGEILYDEKGNPEILLGAIQDVSELREAEEEIHRLAFHDGLTGLANRMLFLDRLGMEVTSAKRKDEVFALLFLDLPITHKCHQMAWFLHPATQNPGTYIEIHGSHAIGSGVLVADHFFDQ
ncbi:MAG: response regulator, partial [Desulfocapsa sp.]|nr:response regulator [Desulfocapsa sp.]